MLANKGSENYLEKDKQIFDNENIELSYHNYNSIEYNQHGDIFFKDLSILDLLFSENENSKILIYCHNFTLYFTSAFILFFI